MNRKSVVSIALLILAFVVSMVVLAKLQWDWLSLIRSHDLLRMDSGLNRNAAFLKNAFDQEIEGLADTFRIPGGDRALLAKQLEEKQADLHRESRWPNLLESVYLISPDRRGNLVLERFDSSLSDFETLEWPPELEPMREEVRSLMLPAGSGRERFQRIPLHAVASVPALLVETALWNEGGASESQAAWLGLRLDDDYFRTVFLPELIESFFSVFQQFKVEIAVVEPKTERLLYSTIPIESFEEFGSSDVIYGLANAGTNGWELPQQRSWPRKGAEAYPNKNRPLTEDDHQWFRYFWAGSYYSGYWHLHARRGDLSPEQQAGGSRRWAKATASGILALGCLAVVLLAGLARRAYRLGQQQMRFVASVSHELRTPVAVLSAVGENLSDAVLDSPGQQVEYGGLIQHETRRLGEMVENLLHMARKGSAGPPVTLRPLDLTTVALEALQGSRWQILNAEFDLDEEIPPVGTLQVMGNPRALHSAIQNLVSNALKYGEKARWMGFEVSAGEGQGGPEVQISVRDRGPGIDRKDLDKLFGAFYRGQRARDEEIQGSGLGLAVVHDVAKAHKGRVTVQSSPGEGSCFTIHLPRIEAP